MYRIPIQFAFTLLTIKIKSISLFKRCFRYLVRFFFLTFMFSFSHLLVECIAELHPVKDHYPEALAWCLNYRNDESFFCFQRSVCKRLFVKKIFRTCDATTTCIHFRKLNEFWKWKFAQNVVWYFDFICLKTSVIYAQWIVVFSSECTVHYIQLCACIIKATSSS